jgi:hypothetical protein
VDQDLIQTILANSLAAIKAKYIAPGVSLTNPVTFFEVLQIVAEQYSAATKIVEPPPPPPAP